MILPYYLYPRLPGNDDYDNYDDNNNNDNYDDNEGAIT